MYFRKAEETDAEVLNLFMEDLVHAKGNLKKIREKVKRIHGMEQYYLCLAYEGDEILGTAMGILCEDICEECERFLVIENVYVKEPWRGKGVAKAIFAELERWSKEHNCYYSMLVSGNDRKRAHAFYEKAGYEKMGGFRKMY